MRFVYKTIVAAVMVLFVGGLMACEKGMTIAVTKDSNPPSFKLSESLEADGGWIRFTIKDGKTVVLSSGY